MNDSEKILNRIQKDCYIIYVTIRRWDGQYLVKDVDIELNGNKVQDKTLFTKPRWKLLPQKWHKIFTSYQTKCRKIIYQTATILKDGIYIVPKSAAEDLINKLKKIREEYKKEVNNFSKEYYTLVENLKEKILQEYDEETWEKIDNLLPREHKIRDLFDIEIGFWPISSSEIPSDIYELANKMAENEPMEWVDSVGYVKLAKKLTERILAQPKKISLEEAQDWVKETREVTTNLIKKVANRIVTEPIEEFQRAVDHIIEIKNKNSCRRGTIAALKKAYLKLLGFSFIADQNLIEKLKSVEISIENINSSELNKNTEAGNLFTNELKEISSDFQKEVDSIKKFGRPPRYLDL